MDGVAEGESFERSPACCSNDGKLRLGNRHGRVTASVIMVISEIILPVFRYDNQLIPGIRRGPDGTFFVLFPVGHESIFDRVYSFLLPRGDLGWIRVSPFVRLLFPDPPQGMYVFRDESVSALLPGAHTWTSFAPLFFPEPRCCENRHLRSTASRTALNYL